MRAIVHDRLGLAQEVLTLKRLPDPGPLDGDEVLIRVTIAAIHHGDLLAIEGSPAFGEAVTIPVGGRVPGFKGVGIIEAVGAGVASDVQIRIGDRVAFFPVEGTWRDHVIAPSSVLVRLPADVSDEAAAQMLINGIKAQLVLATGHNSLPANHASGVTVIQTAANSAVGLLLTALLIDNGVSTIRLVRSEKSASALAKRLPGASEVATSRADWLDVLRREIDGRPVFTVFDGVGGPLLSDIASFLIAEGTIVNYGSLGGVGSL